MIATPLTLLAGFFYRLGTILLDAAPYLLLSACTVGIIRGIIGTHRLRSLFQNPSPQFHPLHLSTRAALIGFFTPICALSLLPFLALLKNAGIHRTPLIAFAFAAAIFHPATLAYALSTFELSTFLLLLLGALLTATAGALFAHHFDPPIPSSPSTQADPLHHTSTLRLHAACYHAAHAWNSHSLRLALLGIVPAAITSALLSPTFLADAFFNHDHNAIPRMLAIAPAVYSTPERAITALPYFRIFDQSLGAGLLFLWLGSGITFAHIPWLTLLAGRRSLATVLLPTLLVAAILALVAHRYAPSIGSPNPDNDHLNSLANPFSDAISSSELQLTLARLIQNTEPTRWVALSAFLLLVTCGKLIPAPPPPSREPSANPATPILNSSPERFAHRAWLLIPLLALGVSAVLIYFPPPEEIFAEIQEARANAFSELSNPSPHASLAQLDRWNRLTGKLPLAMLIRGRLPSAQAADSVAQIQSRLQLIIRQIRTHHRDEARQAFLELNQLCSHSRSFFLDPL